MMFFEKFATDNFAKLDLLILQKNFSSTTNA